MKLRTAIQFRLPQHALSRLAGKIANCHWRWLKNLFITIFIKIYKIDMSEAVEENPKNYATFNSFFTRAIKPELRPISSELSCPVDGTISQYGIIDGTQLIQAKGYKFDLKNLCGQKLADHLPLLENGDFITLYLSPQDYHRIHMPLDGQLMEMVHVPGTLFAVNPLTTKEIPNLYTSNERVITLFDTAIGPIAIVLVGAIFVSSIETVWAGQITPPQRQEIRLWNYSSRNISLERGAELGRFQFGSTVIIILPKNSIRWAANLAIGNKVQMGQNLAECLKK